MSWALKMAWLVGQVLENCRSGGQRGLVNWSLANFFHLFLFSFPALKSKLRAMQRRNGFTPLLALLLLAPTSLAVAKTLETVAAYVAVDEFSQSKFAVNSSSVTRESRLPPTALSFSDQRLLRVLINTRAYFTNFSSQDPVVRREGILGSQGIKVRDVLATLDYMIQILQEDQALNRPTRLRDANFINQNFRVINWLPYPPKTPQPAQKLRITRYAVFIHEGSRQKTAKFNTPLYALLDNADGDRFYKKYTKQQVLAGIYEPGGKEFGRVKPLAYLTRTAFEEALMQGTILVRFPKGSSAYFNVDRNNGIPYDKALAPQQQKRYWYFRQVDGIKGYGNTIKNKINIEPGVTFAGDVFNIGLGRVVVLESETRGQRSLRLGVIADTGGAFLPNLYQLDYLAGIFPDRQTFFQQTQAIPDYARTYILIKK